jgi:S1-C subfamily serine protease
VNLLDAIILVALAGAAIGGYRLGFLARVTSWIGLGIGLYVAARSLPSVVELLSGNASSTSRLLLAAVLLVGGAFIGQALGIVAGSKLRTVLPPGPLRAADHLVGAIVGALGVVISVWFLLPAMSEMKGDVARLARTSRMAGLIDTALPAPPPTLRALRGLVDDTGFPKVFEGLNRAPAAGPPPANSGLSPEVLARVSASTVKIEGRACSRIQDGSGFVTSTDTVVTNAHVVAGDTSPIYAIRLDGKKVKMVVSVMDTDRDLAVLKAASGELGLKALPLVPKTASEASTGAVLGHPGGQEPLAVAPSQVSRRVDAVGRDLYDKHPIRRDVFILASHLAPGYSGGPFVTVSGEVAGVAFAIAPDRDNVAYALTDVELRKALLQDRGGEVSTGRCL